jgi:aspartate racemase
MKTIGIIGGMSWESSLVYYRIINEIVRERLGGLHSAPSLMVSVDFAPIEAMQASGDWDGATEEMIRCARQLESGGAECVLIATNTMHLMFNAVQAAISLPMIHIADAAGQKIQSMGITTVGLLGTKFTMEMDFYSSRLREKFGIETIVPDAEDREIINQVIYKELVLGKINEESKKEYLRIIHNLHASGVQAVILGCTEIPLLVRQEDSEIPLLDTTYLHAQSAVDFALDA